MSGTFLLSGEINIAFPILLVNRESDIFMENPIFYVLIDKRKPTRGGLFGVCYGREKARVCNYPKG